MQWDKLHNKFFNLFAHINRNNLYLKITYLIMINKNFSTLRAHINGQYNLFKLNHDFIEKLTSKKYIKIIESLN